MEQKTKKRIVNFRSFLFIALSLFAAVLFISLNFIISPLGLILFAAEIMLILALFFVSAYRNAPTYKLVTYMAAIVLMLAAAANIFIVYTSQTFADEEKFYTVGGKVDDTDRANGRIVLKNLVLDGEKTGGRLMLYTDFEEFEEFYALQVGDQLTFGAYLRNSPVVGADGRVNAFAHRSRVLYRCYEHSEAFNITKARPDFFQGLSESIKSALAREMGETHGMVAYGFITGDKSGIFGDVRDAYSVSGLAHILAVSGLHVGFLSAMLLGFLRLLRIKKLPSNIITMAVLFFYAFFTGFTPSVLRAVTMAFVMMAAMVFSKKYDALNAFSAAAALILAVRPFYLFDVGFILSVAAVYGIILFARPLTGALTKIKFPRYIARLIAVSVAVQIGILPVFIIFFGRVQVYAIFLNILLMPLINLAFVCIFVSLLLTLVFQPLGVLLQFSGILMAFIDTAALSAATLPYASLFVPAGVFTGLLFLCFPLYFAASRFVMRPGGRLKIFRAAMCLTLSASLVLCAVFSTRYYGGTEYLAPVAGYRDVTTVVSVGAGRVYVVGDFRNFYAVDNILKKLNVRRVDGIFLFSVSQETAQALARFSCYYRAGKIMAYEPPASSVLSFMADNGVNNFYVFDGLSTVADGIAPVIAAGRLLAYELYTENGSVLLCGYKTNYTRVPAEALDRAYAVRCFMFLDVFPERLYLTNMESGYAGAGEPAYQYSAADTGDFLFDYAAGKVFALSG